MSRTWSNKRDLPAALAALAVCAVLAWPSSGRAYTLGWTKSGAIVRWNAALVMLRIDPALAVRAQDVPMAALVGEAAAAWQGLENVPEILVEDGEPGSPGYHDGRASNGVYWVDDWLHGADALAITITTFQTESGKILDSDVLVHGDYSFAQLAHDPTRPYVYDLLGILTHEFGHVLGLGESCEPGATMWPVVSPGETFQRDLDADDRAGAERLYEDGLLSEIMLGRGCAGASVLGRAPRGAAGPGYLWGVFAVLVVATLRRPSGRYARAARSVLAIGGLVCWGASAGAEDPSSTPPGDPVSCYQLAGGDAAAEQRTAKLVDGAARVVTGRAVRMEAYERDGLIWTRFRVEGRDLAGVELEVPGGTLGDLTQVVSHHSMPRDGETLVVGLRDHGGHSWAHFRDGAVYGGTLGEGPAAPWEP